MCITSIDVYHLFWLSNPIIYNGNETYLLQMKINQSRVAVCTILFTLTLSQLFAVPSGSAEAPSMAISTEFYGNFVIPGEKVHIELSGIDSVQESHISKGDWKEQLNFTNDGAIWQATLLAPDTEGIYTVTVRYSAEGSSGTLMQNFFLESHALYLIPKSVSPLAGRPFGIDLTLLDWKGCYYLGEQDCTVTLTAGNHIVETKSVDLNGTTYIEFDTPLFNSSTQINITVEIEGIEASESATLMAHPYYINITAGKSIEEHPNFSLLGPYLVNEQFSLKIQSLEGARVDNIAYVNMALENDAWHNIYSPHNLSFTDPGVYLVEARSTMDNKTSIAKAFIMVNDRPLSTSAVRSTPPGNTVEIDVSALNSNGMIVGTYIVNRQTIASLLARDMSWVRTQGKYAEAIVKDNHAAINIRTKPNELEGEYLIVSALISEDNGINYHGTSVITINLEQADRDVQTTNYLDIIFVFITMVAMPSLLILFAAGRGRK